MKGLVLLVVVVTVVVFASGVMAQQPQTTKPPFPASAEQEKTGMPKADRFIGKLLRVDEAAQTVVVKNPEAEKTFSIGNKTKITGGGKEMPLADLKEGMNVSVSYRTEAEKATASVITVSLPKPADRATPKRTVIKSAETPPE